MSTFDFGGLEGYTPLQIHLDADGAWPELLESGFEHGKATHVGVLPDGTHKKKPSVAIRGKLDDGTEVVLETTWALFNMAHVAIAARYGVPE